MKEIVIIGGGPAGLTAAIYAARANLSPLVIEGYQPGGQLTITTEVENYPGFSDGVLGPDLMTAFRKQAERFGTEFVFGEVTAVDFSSRPLTVTTEEETYETKAVIIATGASARWLGLESEQKYRGRGVSACATCDGFFFKDKNIAVVGGGDSAAEEALYLTKFGKKVTLIHRRSELRASKIMQQRLLKNEKISFSWNTTVEEVVSENGHTVTGLRIKNVQTGETSLLPVDGLFLAIGHTPNTSVFKGHIELDAEGYIVTKAQTESSVPGVFASGDVVDKRYRQAITAAGMGCMAALDAEKYLVEHEG
jgi:thioredoxin reductase (NADPH)